MSDDLSKVGMRHDTDCGLLYDDGPEVCTCRPISGDLATRMAALIRRLIAEAEENLLDPELVDYTPGPLLTEARAIVALLPEPVDADLVEAREMAIDLMSKTVIANGNPQAAPEIVRIREGKGDTNSYVVACLAAIRRGRALERDSREG